MDGIEYIYKLCEPLPRCGPGDNESTLKAFNVISDLPDNPKILDIGCGTGMQTIALAQRSKGEIIALDNCPIFLDRLKEKIQDQGIAKITLSNQSMSEMDFPAKSFDVIWSEGALYCMGFAKGLKRCQELVKEGGYIAVSELVYLDPEPPHKVKAYLESEYPDIQDVPGNIQLVQSLGLTILDHFTVPESAWLNNYYLPMDVELLRLKKEYAGNEKALTVFDSFQYESDFYKEYKQYYGYEFFILKNK